MSGDDFAGLSGDSEGLEGYCLSSSDQVIVAAARLPKVPRITI